MDSEKTASSRGRVPACCLRGEAHGMQSARTPTRRPAAVRRQTTMPGNSRGCSQLTCPLSSACVECKVLFPSSRCWTLHAQGKSSHPKEQLSCLAFFVLPCYLLNRHLCGGLFFFLSTHTQYLWGRAQVGAGSADAGGDAAPLSSSYYLGHAPLCSSNHCQWQSDYWRYNCSKLMLIIWIFYFIFGCSGNLALTKQMWLVWFFCFFFFSFGYSCKIFGYRRCYSCSLDIQGGL